MDQYIILTNKEEYQTDLNNEGLEVIETYDYYFFDHLKAKYTIAKVHDNSIKIKLTEEKNDKVYVNRVPVKFFETFEKLEEAHDELRELSGPNSDSSQLKLAAN
ncbi:hypothetical protein SAMN05192534_1029 [Alteribacillus persepolensis]|uniref:Uncharacterized protein n=1 Tax=Alteribacillus persepolensis TaxID=568899 RepID=A0A1G8A3T7_9BACI|nr:hypothetical protein [Alteribacillus persepolensis]SDH15523.1 hypothetical protein SAMN05192534_1029 [Alteribacillus persepolensis]